MVKTTSLAVHVVVVGAGPAGSAVALTLARRGMRVVVLESQPGPTWKVGETLPPAARPLLARLGVLQEFEADGHLPSYGNHSSWGSPDLAATDFIFDPNGNGWQLDRESFDGRLAKAAEHAGAEVWYESRMRRPARRSDGRWHFEVTVGPERRAVVADWLVDASGRRSAVARQLGARRSRLDALACVYAVAEVQGTGLPEDQDTRTLVEAGPEGWWYTALVPGGRRTVAWLTDLDILRRYPWRDGQWFRSYVETTRHVRALLGRHGYGFSGPPNCSSACSGRVEPCSGFGWLAVGDAALAFDPLSSQGLFNALATGIFGAEALAEQFGGDDSGLRVYAARIEGTWAAYLQNRLSFYQTEERWAKRVFWNRRR